MPNMKTDASGIKKFLEDLAKESWLERDERRVWPKFLFHYTDIRNAVEILKTGSLQSRNMLENMKGLVVSSGSSNVLANTPDRFKGCVRLYFRPKTPTQYYVEGIRSRANLQDSKFPDAHCPVPIFFLFDSFSLLSRKDSRFSDGNLGSPKAKIFSTAKELAELPWHKIYHNSSLTEKSDIIFHRNAEVIIPQHVELEALQYIYCRSEAEKETFLYLLPQSIQQSYQRKIVSTTSSFLFYRQHTFIEKVRLSCQSVDMYFSPDTKSLGPFDLNIELERGSEIFRGRKESFMLPDGYKLNLPLPSAHDYAIRIFLDTHLTYANTYHEPEPF